MKLQMAAIGFLVLASSGCTPAASGSIVKASAWPTQESGLAAKVESDAEDRAWDDDEPRVIKRERSVWLYVYDYDRIALQVCFQEPTCEMKHPRDTVFVHDEVRLVEPGFVDWLNREAIVFRLAGLDSQRELLKKPVARKLERIRLALETTDADLTQVVSAMPQLRELDLVDTEVSDTGMAEVSKLRQLRVLHLHTTMKVSDVGMAEVSKLGQLRVLDLGGTKVSDAGMAEVSKLNQLRELDLSSTKVGDTGMAEVSKLNQLRELNPLHTQLSAARCAQLYIWSYTANRKVFCQRGP